METVKIAKTFICVNCDYKCYKESNFIKHKLTVKHKKTENETEKFQSSKIPIKFICECGNEYKQRQGLWAHKRKCVFNKEEKPEKNNEIINLLIENNKQLQDENKEFKNIIIHQNAAILELTKNGINSNNTNSNNTTFNLNFFLNDTCKDAVNIEDFIKNILVSNEDLLTYAEYDFEKATTDLIVKNINL